MKLNTENFASGIISENILLPAWYESLKKRLDFPLSFKPGKDFAKWQNECRDKLYETAVPDLKKEDISNIQTDIDIRVLSEEDRGSYVCRSIVFKALYGARIPALLLIPKKALSGEKCPAAVFFHDHGAFFNIGKEKIIRPPKSIDFDKALENVSEDGDKSRMNDFVASACTEIYAKEWAVTQYGGAFAGDSLAQKGWVVLCADALGWGERTCTGWEYDSQQALASNLLYLGTSYASVIAQDDVITVQAVSVLDFVDKERIATVGFSMGALRAWQAAAIMPQIKACASVCWMACLKDLIYPENSQTRGQSTFTICHPFLHRYMDYPDIASLVCPRPLLLIAGQNDKRFPANSVKAAYDKIDSVYKNCGLNAQDKLSCYVMAGGHDFGIERQKLVFDWLEKNV